MITMIWDNFPSGILRHWNVQMSYHVLPHYIKFFIASIDMMVPQIRILLYVAIISITDMIQNLTFKGRSDDL